MAHAEKVLLSSRHLHVGITLILNGSSCVWLKMNYSVHLYTMIKVTILCFARLSKNLPPSIAEKSVVWSDHVPGTSCSREDQLKTWPHE